MRRIWLFSVIATALSIFSPFRAQGVEDYTVERIGNWHIDIDPSLDNGCYAGIGAYDGSGEIVSMHIGYNLHKFVNEQQQGFFLSFTAKNWSFAPGTVHNYKLEFNTRTITFNGNASSIVSSNGWSGVWIMFSNNQLSDEYYENKFSRAKTMYFQFDQNKFPPIELTDISEVMSRLRVCENKAALAVIDRKHQERMAGNSKIVGEPCSKYLESPYQFRPGFSVACVDTNNVGEKLNCYVHDDGEVLQKTCLSR